MCKPNSKNVMKELYKNEDVLGALQVHSQLITNYRLIHNNKHYAVYQHKEHHNDIIIWNLHLMYKDDKDDCGHTHLKSVKVAKTICNKLAKNEKPPRNASRWILRSYLRLLDECYSHKEWIESLLDVKLDKVRNNNYYLNSSKGVKI